MEKEFVVVVYDRKSGEKIKDIGPHSEESTLYALNSEVSESIHTFDVIEVIDVTRDFVNSAGHWYYSPQES